MALSPQPTTAKPVTPDDHRLRALETTAPGSNLHHLRGQRVTVMGLGRHGGGLAAARYLAQQGAEVTISDMAERASLAESIAALGDVRIGAMKFGGHDHADFHTAQCVVVNPAVRMDHPCLQIARDAGATLTSEIELFLRRCPANVIGVTGSNGKSTTCSMLSAMLTLAGRRTWLGGNIGRSLLSELGKIRADDWVVLELSSFQLAHLSASAPLPLLAVITNCTPNHLDWHGTYEAYASAKKRLLENVSDAATVVLNGHDPEAASWTHAARSHVCKNWPLEEIPPLKIPGQHNRHNASCAATAATAAGVSEAVICDALRQFTGLAHRLEFLGEVAGRRFFNDSKSTTPRATIAALEALRGPTWLLAGGHPKGASFDELASAIVGRARGAALFGAARELLNSNIVAERGDFQTIVTEQLTDALAWCWRQSRAGDAILLSPACASYDQFRDFEERGEAFRRWVVALAMCEP